MSHQRFLCILLLLLLLPATLVTYFVFPATGDILRVPDDYSTIQEAVNAARTGDTIQVAARTYFENVVVNASVTIIGESAATTIVDGGGNDVIFDIQEDNVELQSLTIRNGGSHYNGVTIYYPYAGLVIRNTRIVNNVVGVVISEADGNTIEDNVFIDNSMYSIDVKYSSGNIIRDNQLSESAYGIEISDTSNSQVVNNTVSFTSYGIYAPYSNNNNISANTLTSNSWNVYLTHSNSNIVGNNAASGGSVGIQVMRSEGNSVINNTVSDSSYGIYLGYCGANTVSGNIASLNDWGIEVYNSTGSTIKENRIAGNTWGFYIAENSNGNYLFHNNVINNVKQVFQDSTSGQNVWRTPTTPYEGNYWSDYKGTDTNGDGIGDTYLPWKGVDWYPLMEPYGFFIDIAIIDAALSDTEAYPGEIVDITVVAENQGTLTETFSVTVKYENTTFAIFGTVGTQEVIDLNQNENVTLVFHWNTIDVQYCVNYTIIAEATVLPDEVNPSNNVSVAGAVKVKMLGDINGDGVVNIADLAAVARAYGTEPGDSEWNPEADLNGDEIIDIDDLIIVAQRFGDTC